MCEDCCEFYKVFIDFMVCLVKSFWEVIVFVNKKCFFGF